MKAALAEVIPPPDDEISRQELRDIMEEVVAEASPATDQIDVAELVSESVSESVSEAMAGGPTPITKAEVERLIQAEIAPLRKERDATAAQTPEVIKSTIVFSDLPWQSARIQNRIAMFIVEHGYGFPVDKIPGETQVLWNNLLDGDSLVTMEVWLPNQQEAWDDAIINGAVIPLGKSLDANWQGFVVPTYLTRHNLLKDIGDINDEDIISLFLAPGTEFDREKKAVLVTCPVGTECHDINLAKIKAYKLEPDVELVAPSSFFALEDSLERAYADGRPWLGYMWGPSRLSEELDLTILKEPEFSDECWATTKGCAYPTARVLIAVHPSMLTIAPDVVEFLRRWDFTARRLILSERWMDDHDAAVEETAIFFLKTWPADWTRCCATSFAGPSRSRRAVSESRRVVGIARSGSGSLRSYCSSLSTTSPDSRTLFVSSSTNSGTPSVLATICSRTLIGSRLPPVMLLAISSICFCVSGWRGRCMRFEPLGHGGSNSGRNVATRRMGTTGTCARSTAQSVFPVWCPQWDENSTLSCPLGTRSWGGYSAWKH